MLLMLFSYYNFLQSYQYLVTMQMLYEIVYSDGLFGNLITNGRVLGFLVGAGDDGNGPRMIVIDVDE